MIVNGVKYNFFLQGQDDGTSAKILDAIGRGALFALKCPRSAVIFDVNGLRALWVGKEKAVWEYGDLPEFLLGIKMQYVSHREFVPIDTIEKINQIKLIA